MIIKKYEKFYPHFLAFVAAFCIFLLMQYLISTDVFNKKNDEDISYLEFIRINTDDSLLKEIEKFLIDQSLKKDHHLHLILIFNKIPN